MIIDERLVFRTSSHSGNGANCVDVALHAAGATMRDTKDDADGAELHFGHSQWAAFLDEVINDRPSANGAVTVTRGHRELSYGARRVTATWHVHAVAGDVVLHYTEGEWQAFRAGAADGEFSQSALTPAS